MQYAASLGLLTGLDDGEPLPPGAVELAIELDSVPSLSAAERTVGFDGTKEEDFDRTSVFGRPRIAVGLPGGWSLEGSYLPPVDISGIEPELVALAVGRAAFRQRAFPVAFRLVAQRGRFDGDITCSAREIAEGPNEFGCETPSADTMDLESLSFETTVSRRSTPDRRLAPYLALALHRLDLDFQVRAEYRGLVDRSTLSASGTTYSAALGVTTRAGDRWRAAAELFFTPLEVARPPGRDAGFESFVNLRLALRYRIRNRA